MYDYTPRPETLAARRLIAFEKQHASTLNSQGLDPTDDHWQAKGPRNHRQVLYVFRKPGREHSGQFGSALAAWPEMRRRSAEASELAFLGCGVGHEWDNVAALGASPARLVFCDLDEAAVDIARFQRPPSEGCTRLSQLAPFNAGGVIVANFVLHQGSVHHDSGMRQLAGDLCTLLPDGGVLLSVEPSCYQNRVQEVTPGSGFYKGIEGREHLAEHVTALGRSVSLINGPGVPHSTIHPMLLEIGGKA